MAKYVESRLGRRERDRRLSAGPRSEEVLSAHHGASRRAPLHAFTSCLIVANKRVNLAHLA